MIDIILSWSKDLFMYHPWGEYEAGRMTDHDGAYSNARSQ